MTEPLTKPQLKFLKLAAQPNGARAVSDYPPVVRLQALGFIESVGSMVNWYRCWKTTDAGLERLKKCRSRKVTK